MAKSIKAKILLIEGKRADRPSFSAGLTKKGFYVESVPNGSAALARLGGGLPHLVIVDAASMRTSGKRICQALKDHAEKLPIVLILGDAPEGSDKPAVEVVLVQPFTLQKLINRIRPLVPSEPKDLLKVGMLQLDVEQRLVRCQDKQVRLTPRLIVLLKILMEHPGELIDRKELFRRVWDTSYTVDTRTLDVHISWLRQAIEEDPRHPKFIKTVRGAGYRLDVENVPRPVPAPEDKA
jgi:DNA-binding response OmpR family regulator